MITYDSIILKFDDQGEKTGWTYIDIPADIAQQLKPGNKKSFRVKGLLDAFPIRSVALMPMGEGNFIMAINAGMRKGIHKRAGAMLRVTLEEDTDTAVVLPDELEECFEYEPEARTYYDSLAQGHQRYFITWINTAKTAPTRANRIENMMKAMINKWDYGQMIRAMRKKY